MTPLHRWGGIRRKLPQTVRVRLTLLYAGLFLVAGATLLGLTYGLVASGLPIKTPTASKASQLQQVKLQQDCKTLAAGARPRVVRAKPRVNPVPQFCQKVFAEAVNAAAADQRDQTLHNLLLFSLLGLGVMTVASGGLGWVMAGRVLRPVRRITETARRASEQHLGERLALRGPKDELKELADTFDEMLDRLDAAFASQGRFVADASHELRTPLTVMRTAIDVTLAKPSRSPEQLEVMAAKVRRSVDKAEALIDALLTLAMSERELTGGYFVDLATVAEDALEIAQPTIVQLDLQVATELEPAETSGDRLLLERLVANLVENAVRHNNTGGWLRLRTGTDRAGVFLSVANSGPVIPVDRVQSLFEPFRRIEERTSSREGAGLGLTIVQSISTAHNGNVEILSQSEGGLVVSVHFPRDNSQNDPIRPSPST